MLNVTNKFTCCADAFFYCRRLICLRRIHRTAMVSCVADALIGRKLIKHQLIKITAALKGQKAIS